MARSASPGSLPRPRPPTRPGRRGCSAPRALSSTPGVVPIVPGFELFYDPTYEALTEGLGDAFDPLFDAGRAAAASGRALTPEVWADEPVSAASA